MTRWDELLGLDEYLAHLVKSLALAAIHGHRTVSVLSLVFGIAEVQRDAPLRIDGEVIFPDGSAVNWRELWTAQRADRITRGGKDDGGRSAPRHRLTAGIGQHA
jgi:hypothetical protein